MSDHLRAYFDRMDAKPLDPTVLAEYERSMREEVIPKIEEDLRRQARARVCLIYHPRGCECSN